MEEVEDLNESQMIDTNTIKKKKHRNLFSQQKVHDYGYDDEYDEEDEDDYDEEDAYQEKVFN
jgi:hypothetical protein